MLFHDSKLQLQILERGLVQERRLFPIGSPKPISWARLQMGYPPLRIVDFGLASVRDADQLTKSGSTMGTVGYMSPEQVQGKEVDHRSDLFSLGVVLYELIARQNPFRRETEAATLKAVSDDHPEPLARFKRDIPEGVQAIIDKAL